MAFTRLPAIEDIHQGCFDCSCIEKIAPMDLIIAVGFGEAKIIKDNKVIYAETVYDEEDGSREQYFDLSRYDFPTLERFEALAQKDPDHDWRIILNAPLRYSEYQRQGNNKWILIKSGKGFA